MWKLGVELLWRTERRYSTDEEGGEITVLAAEFNSNEEGKPGSGS